jgi:hypothetical protein
VLAVNQRALLLSFGGTNRADGNLGAVAGEVNLTRRVKNLARASRLGLWCCSGDRYRCRGHLHQSRTD